MCSHKLVQYFACLYALLIREQFLPRGEEESDNAFRVAQCDLDVAVLMEAGVLRNRSPLSKGAPHGLVMDAARFRVSQLMDIGQHRVIEVAQQIL